MIFKPSKDVDEFIEKAFWRVEARIKAVLGRAGLFLALGQGIPPDFRPPDSKGKDLNDETVIGDELKDVVRAALNYRTGKGKALEDKAYREQFRRHFDYGCRQLKKLWEDSGKDQVAFVAELLELCRLDTLPGQAAGSALPAQALPIVSEPVNLKLLVEGEPWMMNEAGQNSLLVVSGKPGTGKSQLALDLLSQIARQGVRFIFFDLKGELEDNPQNLRQRENRDKFFELTGAKSVRLIEESLPINPLLRDENPKLNPKIAYEMAELIRCFAPQLGAKQERAIAEAYRALPAPDFAGLAEALEGRGANGVELSLIKKIADFNLFAPDRDAIAPSGWLQSSLVVDFKEFGNDSDTKSLAVALILNFLMKRLNQNIGIENGVQPLKCVLFVDEAHLLLPKEGKAGLLGSLARQGRSWGFPVWLASQDAEAFITTGANATNFAELAARGIYFSPETLNAAKQRQLFGNTISMLPAGEALLRNPQGQQTGKPRQFWRDEGK